MMESQPQPEPEFEVRALGLPPNRFVQIGIRASIQLIRLSWAVALSVLLALVVAVIVSDLTAETTWPVESSIVYSRLPIDASAERLYAPPDLRTAASLITSPQVLQAAIDDQNLDLTPRALAAMLDIDEPRGTQKISLSLNAGTVDEGRKILAALVLAYQEHIASMRRRQVALSLHDIEESLNRNAERLTDANTRLDECLALQQITDPVLEAQSMISNIAATQYRIEAAETEEQSLRVQYDAVQTQLDDQKRQAAEEAASADEEAAAEESLADNRRRQDRLNELIREERRLNEIRATLEAKQAEFDRKAVLHERGYLSEQDFEAVLAELEALKAQIAEGDKIRQWQAELERIDKMVVPKAKSKRVGSPIVHQTMFKLVELQLGILASQERQRHLRMTLADARKRLNELKAFQTEQAGLITELDAINEERRTLNKQVSALKAIYDLGPREFVVAQAPSAAMAVPNSNRKKIFAILFLGSASTLVSPLLLLAILASSRMSICDYVEQLQLTVLTPRRSLTDSLFVNANTDLTAKQNRWARNMALRTQQAMTRIGKPIAFCSATEAMRQSDTDRLLQVAEYLAMTDQRVLVVSLPGSQPGAADPRELGFFDFVDNDQLSIDDVIENVGDRIDFVSGGRSHPERLLSRRANAFFETAANRYTVVLVNGPALPSGTDVEMLLRHCQGVFALVSEDDPATKECKQTLKSLVEAEAPIFGVATRVIAARQPGVRIALPKMRHDKQGISPSRVARRPRRLRGRRLTPGERKARRTPSNNVDEMIDELTDNQIEPGFRSSTHPDDVDPAGNTRD